VAVAALLGGLPQGSLPDRGSWEDYLSRRESTTYMDCNGTALCGVLTVESGFGDGYYKHKQPSVHGLWPECPDFGSSACIAPDDGTDPTIVFSCYIDGDVSQEHQLEFEQHEWDKHGKCAGVRNATSFFQQICALSAAPVKQMTKARQGGMTNTEDFAADLKAAGFPVWATMGDGQVQLSACGDSKGAWHLGMPDEFVDLCGASTPPHPPTPSNTTTCQPSKRGPACSDDSDCEGLAGCIRCAHTGFCTSIPIL